MKKKSSQFDKFTRKKSNAAIKEQFKQEKRKIKKEREEYFEAKRVEVRKLKSEAAGQGTGSKDRRSATPGPGGTAKSDPVKVRPGGPQPSNLKAQTSNTKKETPNQQLMPLNKFLAHSGISGRREAADIVKQGTVKVNNIVVTEPSHKVSANDDIRVNGKKIFLAKNLVYI